MMTITHAAASGASGQAGRHAVSPEQDKKLHATAQSFETMFLNVMFEQMSSGLQVDGMFGGGNDERIYRSMQNEQFSKAVAKQGGIGIADSIYREMLRMQENQPAPAARGRS